MKKISALKLTYFLKLLFKNKNKNKTKNDSKIPSLSDEEINNIEGKITLKEVYIKNWGLSHC